VYSSVNGVSFGKVRFSLCLVFSEGNSLSWENEYNSGALPTNYCKCMQVLMNFIIAPDCVY